MDAEEIRDFLAGMIGRLLNESAISIKQRIEIINNDPACIEFLLNVPTEQQYRTILGAGGRTIEGLRSIIRPIAKRDLKRGCKLVLHKTLITN